MDFNVNVKLDATPALVGAVSTLVNAISGAATQVKNAFPTAQAAHVETVSPTIQEQINTSDTQDGEEEVTMEKIRALTAQKGDKRAEMKAILKDMGVDKIPDLPKEKYIEFYSRIVAL